MHTAESTIILQECKQKVFDLNNAGRIREVHQSQPEGGSSSSRDCKLPKACVWRPEKQEQREPRIVLVIKKASVIFFIDAGKQITIIIGSDFRNMCGNN